jgi:hypothetical protein
MNNKSFPSVQKQQTTDNLMLMLLNTMKPDVGVALTKKHKKSTHGLGRLIQNESHCELQCDIDEKMVLLTSLTSWGVCK